MCSGNDPAWTQIRRGPIALYGENRAAATKLDTTRYDKVVDALSGYGEYVEHPGQIRPGA